jgi:hypothetical protein
MPIPSMGQHCFALREFQNSGQVKGSSEKGQLIAVAYSLKKIVFFSTIVGITFIDQRVIKRRQGRRGLGLNLPETRKWNSLSTS